MKAKVISMIAAVLLLVSGAHSSETVVFTAEFARFLEIRGANPSDMAEEISNGYSFVLENGRLSIIRADNSYEVWQSNAEWYVDSFQLGDVNRDRVPDVCFTVWKSYSFGISHPTRMTNSDASVKCHLFVYSVKDGRIKQLWCSSNLPRPIYSFELSDDGEQTPTLSGVRLTALEGEYTGDYGGTESEEYRYVWSGWGFRPDE